MRPTGLRCQAQQQASTSYSQAVNVRFGRQSRNRYQCNASSTESAAKKVVKPTVQQDSAAIPQKLSPLPKSIMESIDEEEEVFIGVWLPNLTGADVPTMPRSYQRPAKHRRKPGNALVLAARNFMFELKGLGLFILERMAKPDEPLMPDCFGFTLDNDEIHKFDLENPAPGREPIPFAIQVAYDVLLFFVDRVYEGKAIERFWFLETVARMPYFSYTTCLHLYETLGWWRTGGLRLVHVAEEWNELHHLLIMESLGGDRKWNDRFLGQHAAIFYYWALIVFFIVSPKQSYKFSEMLETHAVSTYRQFIIENSEKLKLMPAPLVAKNYYKSSDMYMFNLDSALVRGIANEPPRQPPCETLYDVFVNILEDEYEHVKTMCACQDYDFIECLKVSQTEFGTAETSRRRELWNQWKEDMQEMDRMMEQRAWEAKN